MYTPNTGIGYRAINGLICLGFAEPDISFVIRFAPPGFDQCQDDWRSEHPVTTSNAVKAMIFIRSSERKLLRNTTNKKAPRGALFLFVLAERAGFEPAVGY